MTFFGRVAFALVVVCGAGFAWAIEGNGESPLGPPPGGYRVLSEDGSIRIPFDVYRDDIRVEAVVNGVRLKLLIDNGFLWDQLLFWGSPTIDSLGLKTDGEIAVGGSGDGEPVISKTASDITVAFDDVVFYDQTAVVTPSTSGVAELWAGSHGQLSAAFFKHFVVQVDWDAGVITLIPPGAFNPEGHGKGIELVPLGAGAWAIPVVLNMAGRGQRRVLVQLDLGDGNPLDLVVGGTDRIPLPRGAIEASLGFGVQGEVLGHFGRIKTVKIGEFKVENVLAGFRAVDDDGPLRDRSFIGLPLLSRFNLVFDYHRSKIYLSPCRHFAEPFHHDMSGLRMRLAPGGAMEVVEVYAGSPASDAGIRVGDRVTAVNERSVADYGPGELRPIFRNDGETVELTIARDGEEFEASLVLRPIV